MPMLLVMVSMAVARSFGFRHREVEHGDAVFRVTDAMMGFMLWAGTVALASAVFQAVVPTLPDWVNNLLGAVVLALLIFGGTIWMPFIEHLSQLSPGDVRTRQRRGIVIFARAIPYLYGLVAVLMALVLAGMMAGMGGMILVGVAQIAGFDPASVEVTTWRWLAGGAALLLALFLVPSLLKQGRLQGDWGLPEWQGFVEPGQTAPSGERLFGPLDATLGRLALAVTRPSAKEREVVMPAPTKIDDLRRFPGDIADFAVALVVTMLLLWLLGSAVGTVLGWVAPGLAATINDAMSPAPATPGETRQTQPAEIAVMMLILIPTLLTLVGTMGGLFWLAHRSQDVAWARQGWVRWLARAAELARLLGLALMALVLGGIVGGLAGAAIAPDQPWVGIAIFAVTALVMA